MGIIIKGYLPVRVNIIFVQIKIEIRIEIKYQSESGFHLSSAHPPVQDFIPIFSHPNRIWALRKRDSAEEILMWERKGKCREARKASSWFNAVSLVGCQLNHRVFHLLWRYT